MSASGSTRPSGWGTPESRLWQRTTWQIASVSRIEARNWLPSPSPSEAPLTRPAMSWKEIVAGPTSQLAIATVGSTVVTGSSPVWAPPLVRALKRVDLPAFGSPTIPTFIASRSSYGERDDQAKQDAEEAAGQHVGRVVHP